MDLIGGIAATLTTPTGVLFGLVAIIITGHFGIWRWDREIKERDATIERQRELINRLLDIQQQDGGAHMNRNAVDIIRRQLGGER